MIVTLVSIYDIHAVIPCDAINRYIYLLLSIICLLNDPVKGIVDETSGHGVIHYARVLVYIGYSSRAVVCTSRYDILLALLRTSPLAYHVSKLSTKYLMSWHTDTRFAINISIKCL